MTKQQQKHTCNKEEELNQMYTLTIRQGENIQNMKNKVDEIHKMLLGNGRPGILQDVESLKTVNRYNRFIFPLLVSLLAIGVSFVTALIL